MAAAIDIPAWIALFMGLYSLAAAIGEWRQPGFWAAMLSDFERTPALRFLTGFFVLFMGGAIYMASPWRPGDWLSVLVTVLGGAMALEGALILAMGDRFLGFARRLIGRASRGWAGLSALIGVALIVAALSRLQ
jgi:hypothetical protein